MKTGDVNKNINALGILMAIIVFFILRNISEFSTFLLMIIGLSAGFLLVFIHDKCKGNKKLKKGGYVRMKTLKVMGFIGILWATMCLACGSAYYIIEEYEAAAGMGVFTSIYLFGFSIVAVVIAYKREREESKELKERLEELESKIKEEEK